MNRIVGIDLGTTFSSVACLEDGESRIVPLKNGKKTLPSIVSFDGDEVIVGEDAQKQEYADKCVKRIKRKMGTDFKVKFNNRQFTPEEISAFILKELKEQAEEYLGEEIKTAIITVPAYFNDNQRQATKNAGKLAGLEVLRIVNEPTAASLSYGVKPDDDLNIVVYDLGGGTFDVSVLNVGEGIFEVVSTAGDNNLGGEDFNARIEELVVGKFREETGIDLSADPLAMSKIYEAVESAKRELSEKDAARIDIPFITADESGAKNIDFELTRAEFERLIADYISRTIELTKQAVEDGNLTIVEIDRVIMVGGSSRIPLARAKVEELFGKAPDCGIDPEEVVARGAAIQGGIVQGDISGIVLVDVNPISLGIEVEQGYFVPIIERNTPIPIVAKRVFTTVANNQKSVDVHVLQGESMHSRNNVSLGQFRLEGIRSALKGEPRIEVSFELDVNGILNVTAVDIDSEVMQGITIVNHSRLSEEEIERVKKENVDNYGEEIKQRKKLDKVLRLKTKAETISGRIESIIPPAYRKGMLQEEIAKIMNKVEDAVRSLDAEKINGCIEGLEFILRELKAGSVKQAGRSA